MQSPKTAVMFTKTAPGKWLRGVMKVMPKRPLSMHRAGTALAVPVWHEEA